MVFFAFSFALMQKKQKIKDNPNASRRLSGHRHLSCFAILFKLKKFHLSENIVSLRYFIHRLLIVEIKTLICRDYYSRESRLFGNSLNRSTF